MPRQFASTSLTSPVRVLGLSSCKNSKPTPTTNATIDALSNALENSVFVFLFAKATNQAIVHKK